MPNPSHCNGLSIRYATPDSGAKQGPPRWLWPNERLTKRDIQDYVVNWNALNPETITSSSYALYEGNRRYTPRRRDVKGKGKAVDWNWKMCRELSVEALGVQ
jgi:hypothetical protein